jgi:hypothetical protein
MVEGLSYKKKFTSLKDVDYELCIKILLKYKANVNISLGQNKRRRPYPIFHAILNAKYLKSYLDYVSEKYQVVN